MSHYSQSPHSCGLCTPPMSTTTGSPLSCPPVTPDSAHQSHQSTASPVASVATASAVVPVPSLAHPPHIDVIWDNSGYFQTLDQSYSFLDAFLVTFPVPSGLYFLLLLRIVLRSVFVTNWLHFGTVFCAYKLANMWRR